MKNIKILVLTKFHKLFMEELGIASEKIKIFPNYLNIENEKDNQSKKDYIVYAGRISKEKGVEEVINAFINAETVNLRLKIIGDGPELFNLKEKYKLKNISFAGELNNKEVLNIIKESKAVITGTKLFEGQPTLLCGFNNGFFNFSKSWWDFDFFPYDYKLSYEGITIDLIKKIKFIDSSDEGNKEGESKKYIKIFEQDRIVFKFEQVLNEFN